MKEFILLMAEAVNNIHDLINSMAYQTFGLNVTDKDLHFWIMGFIGMAVFLFVYLLSKWLSKLPFGITALSFLYTMTFMFVLVFGIEIQQALTRRGNMEFIDAIVGLWGFVALFLVYIALIIVVLVIRSLFRKITNKDDIDA
ncbi:membrane protein [Metabacillus indicus]|uniref:Membrane protein n=2 Tax=Bacillaceae TaxID=186817 RepID=A0A084GLS6_METID|nr:membrane protein [Metabacillus indicus]